MAKSGPRSTGEPVVDSVTDPRGKLIDASIEVLARDGFAAASARAIAIQAGVAKGLIYYHFGSMTGLMGATAHELAKRGFARIKEGMGGENSATEWPQHLRAVCKAEAERPDGRAALELMVGARTDPRLQVEVTAVIDRALDFAATELRPILAPVDPAGFLPVDLVADVLGATFLGIVILLQSGRDIDLDRLGDLASALLALSAAPDQ